MSVTKKKGDGIERVIDLGAGICISFMDKSCVVDIGNPINPSLSNLEIVPPISEWREMDGRYYDLGKMITDYLLGLEEKE